MKYSPLQISGERRSPEASLPLAKLYTKLHDIAHHDLADRVLGKIRTTALPAVRQ